jgi:hypothetical protein
MHRLSDVTRWQWQRLQIRGKGIVLSVEKQQPAEEIVQAQRTRVRR